VTLRAPSTAIRTKSDSRLKLGQQPGFTGGGGDGGGELFLGDDAVVTPLR
jgi:hypothetical protein